MSDMVEEIVTYFKGEQWSRVLDVLEERDGPVSHAHVYVDTYIHPLSLDEIVAGFFAKRGVPLERRTEIFTSGQHSDKGSVHGIEPKGQPHFDLLFGYTRDAAIRPSKVKDDVESWSFAFMEEFYAQYPFRTPDAANFENMEGYFNSAVWKKFYEIVEDDRVVHAHANVETSIHPKFIAEMALRHMRSHGWKIDKVVPVAFSMRGQWQGKLVFLAHEPEKIFDIAWMYNPVVDLIPSTRYWLLPETPHYDIRTMAEVPQLIKANPYVMLKPHQIDQILQAL
jgi:hypothetical protein